MAAHAQHQRRHRPPRGLQHPSGPKRWLDRAAFRGQFCAPAGEPAAARQRTAQRTQQHSRSTFRHHHHGPAFLDAGLSATSTDLKAIQPKGLRRPLGTHARVSEWYSATSVMDRASVPSPSGPPSTACNPQLTHRSRVRAPFASPGEAQTRHHPYFNLHVDD